MAQDSHTICVLLRPRSKGRKLAGKVRGERGRCGERTVWEIRRGKSDDADEHGDNLWGGDWATPKLLPNLATLSKARMTSASRSCLSRTDSGKEKWNLCFATASYFLQAWLREGERWGEEKERESERARGGRRRKMMNNPHNLVCDKPTKLCSSPAVQRPMRRNSAGLGVLHSVAAHVKGKAMSSDASGWHFLCNSLIVCMQVWGKLIAFMLVCACAGVRGGYGQVLWIPFQSDVHNALRLPVWFRFCTMLPFTLAILALHYMSFRGFDHTSSKATTLRWAENSLILHWLPSILVLMIWQRFDWMDVWMEGGLDWTVDT